MTQAFQTGLGFKTQPKKAAPTTLSYQGLNVKDFVGTGSVPLTPEELVLEEINQQKQKLLKEEENLKIAIQALQQTTLQLKEDALKAREQWAINLTAFAFFLTREILECELTTQPESLSQAIQNLIEQTLPEEERVLSLNAEDLALLKEKAADFLSTLEPIKISVVADAQLKRSQAKVSSPSRTLEMDFMKRLEKVKKQIPANLVVQWKSGVKTEIKAENSEPTPSTPTTEGDHA